MFKILQYVNLYKTMILRNDSVNSAISINKLTNSEKQSLYTRTVSDYLNMEAIFSDCTENFVVPNEPSNNEPVTIKIRVGKNNVDDVYICINGNKKQLFKTEENDIFEYFSITIDKIIEKIDYYFIIIKNNTNYYYNKRGLDYNIDEAYNFMIIPCFNTPDWAKGAIMYQIFVDRFYNGDYTNDVVNNEYAYLGLSAKRIEDWNQTPSVKDVCNFYGGDLKGVMDKMTYLKDLGVDVIYFCPIFVSPSNHKYDIQDYDYIDPHLGVIIEDGGEPLYFEKFHNKFATMYIQRTTNKVNLEASNKLMIDLIELAHKHGIKIILDGVFNHCGAFNKWMDKENFYSGKEGYPNGAYKDEQSPYKNYFRWYDNNWPNNDCYDAWWGHDNHPKLNFELSQDLYDYIMNIARKWVSPPFNADGWRIDVAADLGYSIEFNHKFFRDFRKVVKEANPNAIILAEHYGDPKDWLLGDQWDTVMNYTAFMDPITWFLTGMEKHSEEFREDLFCNASAFEGAMRYQMARFSEPSLQMAMNELSNHDHSRFLTRTNMQVGRLHTRGAEAASEGINKSIMLEAVTFQMTWPGAPTIYYGDEAGVTGWTDPDNRRTYPWGNEDMTLINFHKEIIKIHKKYNALKKGSLEFLLLDYGIISYGRWDNKDKIVVILNNNKEQRTISVSVWKAEVDKSGVLQTLIITKNDSFSTESEEYQVVDGYLNITMLPYSSIVLIQK